VGLLAALLLPSAVMYGTGAGAGAAGGGGEQPGQARAADIAPVQRGTADHWQSHVSAVGALTHVAPHHPAA